MVTRDGHVPSADMMPVSDHATENKVPRVDQERSSDKVPVNRIPSRAPASLDLHGDPQVVVNSVDLPGQALLTLLPEQHGQSDLLIPCLSCLDAIPIRLKARPEFSQN